MEPLQYLHTAKLSYCAGKIARLCYVSLHELLQACMLCHQQASLIAVPPTSKVLQGIGSGVVLLNTSDAHAQAQAHRIEVVINGMYSWSLAPLLNLNLFELFGNV